MNEVTRSGFAPANLSEAVTFSDMLAKSSMVPKQYQGKPEDILVAVQWGYELGLAPMQALQNISVINGRPSVFGDAALALVQSSKHCEDIEETMEGDGTENPVAVCVAKRAGRKPVVSKFSVADAKRAGLWGKQGPWTQYPKRMLQMRARGFALRDAFPDVLKGLITQEEAVDYPSEAVRAAEARIEAPKEVVMDIIDPSRLKYHLMLPGQQVYSSHETADEFISEYGNLVKKIKASTKYSKEDKQLKISDLREANEPTRRLLDPVQTLRLSAACATPEPLVEVADTQGDDHGA
jgi:hypothetical protein